MGLPCDLPSLSRFFIPLITGVLAALALNGSAEFAQVTGKVIGTVTDSDTGQAAGE